MTDYRPVDCSLHDRFEAAAVRRQSVTLTWRDTHGSRARTLGVIDDIVVEDGAEWLVMGDGSRIRLDRVEAMEVEPAR